MSYVELQKHYKKVSDLKHALTMLQWDDAAVMPVGGGIARADSIATLSGMVHSMVAAEPVGEWLQNAEQELLSSWERANVREMRTEWEQARSLPADLVVARSRATSRCEQAWRSARGDNNFAGVKAYLSEVLELTREQAACLAKQKGGSLYDALLDLYEPGLKQSDFLPMFGQLRELLPGFANEIIERQAEPKPLTGPFPVSNQKALAVELMDHIGFDFDRGRLDTSHHPFCGGVPDDTRITTRYSTANFLESLFAVLHETGHALYEQGLPLEWRGQPVGIAGGMAMHESQSLLMEMQVCRSAAFLKFATPLICSHLGSMPQESAWSEANLLAHANQVVKGLIRVEADEVTYPLHVILRYEIEIGLIEGDVTVDDLPELWNTKMVNYLGVSTTGDDKNGCMQDVHWFAGLFGYFPTYTLGAIAAAQIFNCAQTNLDDVMGDVSRGDFKKLVSWLRKNIHSSGRHLASLPLIEAVTGEPLNTTAFLSHLKQRYKS